MKDEKIPIFVYGSLKKGYTLNDLLNNAEFLGNAELEGYDLYEMERYPYPIIIEGEHSVMGEVYLVDYTTLCSLNRMECNSGYFSNKKEVTLIDFSKRKALFWYVYRLPDKIKCTFKPDGNWNPKK